MRILNLTTAGKCSRIMLLAGLLAAFSNSAYSSTVASSAIYDGTLLYSDSTGHQTFIRPNAPGNYGLGEASLSMLGAPEAMVEATASSTAGGGGSGGTGSNSGGKITYFFNYVGSSTVPLPIVLQTLLDISLSGNKFSAG